MTLIGRIGRSHGKKGAVKIIPAEGMDFMFKPNVKITVFSRTGEKYEIENIREYNRGRFICMLNGFRSKQEVEGFQEAEIMVE